MDCQQFEESAGAYALEAMSAGERREAEAHLITCANCQRTARELRAVTNLLPLAVPAVAPSPQLKTRIMAAVQADAQRFAAAQRAVRRTHRRPWWQYWQTRLALSLALLLLILAGGLTAWNIVLQRQLAGISANQPISYTIQGTSQAAGARGEATYLPQLHVTILTIHNLPPLQGAEVYQGWLINNNQPESIGLLNIQNGSATLNFPGDIRSSDAIAISREPGPQASQGTPRGQIVAMGSLRNKQGQLRNEIFLVMTGESEEQADDASI
ncbi:MAG: anti-sigma factor [Ktedonobacteraceae bacterium]|nr:anti-sigma factor [Ktedonobacteraceae bacterium]